MRRLLLACTAVALLGCGGDSTGPAASAEGTWNLQTVSGSSLPFTFQTSPTKQEIISDQYVLNAGGTYSEFFTIRETDNGTVTTTDFTDDGTWSQSGNQVSLASSNDGTLVATINGSGDIVTVNLGGGVILVYARQ